MQSLAEILEQHPTPWTVTPEDDGLIWIKDADGNDVDVTGDADEDTLFRAYVEAVNFAATVGVAPQNA